MLLLHNSVTLAWCMHLMHLIEFVGYIDIAMFITVTVTVNLSQQ